MKTILKGILILFLALVGYVAQYTDPCDDEAITEKVSELYGELHSTEKGHRFKDKLQQRFDEFDTPAEEQEGISKAYLEYALRERRECTIPNELRAEMTDFMIEKDKGDTQQCDVDDFKQEAIVQYHTDESFYQEEEFQQKLFKTVARGIRDPEKKQAYYESLKDPHTRENVTIVAIQFINMDKAQCKNKYNPLTGLIMSYSGI